MSDLSSDLKATIEGLEKQIRRLADQNNALYDCIEHDMLERGDLERQLAEKDAFDCFAGAHPHEAYETYPDCFWEYFQRRCPGVPRDEMERMLRETDDTPNAGSDASASSPIASTGLVGQSGGEV